MIPKLIFLSVLAFFSTISMAQDDITAKLTPDAINARIAELRMGEILIKTEPGADVEVQQVRHEFLFGTAIANSLVENLPNSMSEKDRQMYLKILKENFNYAVHENALKWYDCEKQKNVVDYTVADRIWEICHDLDIPMRGHCIFWAKDKYVMDWLKKLNTDELRGKVISRAMDVTSHFKGRISEFDLNNEMINGDFFRRRLGYGIINEMAFAAKAGNPDITLYVNDYGVLVERNYNADSYITQIENLLANGVPIGGIGCQAHTITSDEANSTGQAATTPERFLGTLDKLARFNLPIKITECLFTADKEHDIAEQLEIYFPICFAHPNVEAIVMWGFWAGDHWQPHTAMWKKDWSATPQALAYRDLVFKQWWTQLSGKADQNGEYKADAFYGDYIISSNGKTQQVSLLKKDKTVEVNFKNTM
ncbi:endo-1,4-beta-xylanase [candidate division KSB1 bacterium]|nr:endo-1,4-beta-xylanase [candidate division KSB1 bacterium]